MTDTLLLRQLRRGSQRALEQAIEQYSAYVVTVIRNRSRGLLAPEDHEEIAADVFLALWQNAGRIRRQSAFLAGSRSSEPHRGLYETAS